MRVALEDRRRIGQPDLTEHRERALARLVGADALVIIGTSMSCRPIVMTGLRLLIGS